MKRRKAIGKAIAKTKKEEFSNWKAELGLEEETMVEVAGEEKQKKISEKGVKNKIVINPELKEGIAKLGGEVLEVEEISEEKPYERIDRLNKERIAKQKAAKDAETAKRDKRVADFKKFREGERAKGTRHDHILDKWQQKKIAAKKQQAEAVDSASALSAKQQDTERMQAQNARNEVDINRQAALKQKKRDAAEREALKREIRGEEVENVEEGKSDRPLGVMHSLTRGVKQKRGAKKDEGGKYLKMQHTKKQNKKEADLDAHRERQRNERGLSMYPEEVELDERTRFAKETGKDFKTGNPSEKGGTRSGDSAFDKVSREMRKTGGMMSSRKNPIPPQGKKKVKGAKGYKGVTPVDRIKNKLAQKRAPKPNPYRPRAGESD